MWPIYGAWPRGREVEHTEGASELHRYFLRGVAPHPARAAQGSASGALTSIYRDGDVGAGTVGRGRGHGRVRERGRGRRRSYTAVQQL